MAEPTVPPPSQMPVPTKSGGPVLIIVALLLLSAIGFVMMKVMQKPEPTAEVKPPTKMLATAEPIADTPPPPPPPPPEEDAGATEDSGAKTPIAAGGGGPPCSGTCAGTPSSELQGALRSAGGSARGCYERALRQNAMLQGRMTVSLRVDTSGTVCAARVSQDELHSGEVSSCVLTMFRSRKFPAPKGGCADVSVPLSFSPKG